MGEAASRHRIITHVEQESPRSSRVKGDPTVLPPRSVKLVEATPFHHLESGLKACIEVTVYPDGHAGIAVSEIEGSPPARRIVQRDSLPLNNVDELRTHVLAVIERLSEHAAAAG